jgi:CBS domain-containing protein
MTIGRICNRNVVCATRDTTVVEAANLMRHNHVGDIVVVDETDGRRTPLGIVTDRDIVVEVIAAGLDAKGIRLGDLAISRLSTVDENDSSAEVVRLMAARGVRRLPVVDERAFLSASSRSTTCCRSSPRSSRSSRPPGRARVARARSAPVATGRSPGLHLGRHLGRQGFLSSTMMQSVVRMRSRWRRVLPRAA